MPVTGRFLRLLLVAFVSNLATLHAGEMLRIGQAPGLRAGIAIVAKDQGYFASEGLTVELKTYPSGKAALEAMLAGEVDIASCSGLSAVGASFSQKNFKIIAAQGIATKDVQLLADCRRGILKSADLKGKSIGVFQGGQPQFAFDMLIRQAGLTDKDLQVILGEPQELQDLLQAGKISAICTFGGWVDKAMNVLGTNAVVITDEDLMRVTFLLAARTDTIEKRQVVFGPFFRGLLRAEKFVDASPEKAKVFIADHLGISAETVMKQWPRTSFHLGLEQSLLRDLETMAQWQSQITHAGGKNGGGCPNYLDFLWFKGLESVAPKRISIVHEP